MCVCILASKYEETEMHRVSVQVLKHAEVGGEALNVPGQEKWELWKARCLTWPGRAAGSGSTVFTSHQVLDFCSCIQM